MSRTSWTVADLDSRRTLLVTTWRWYAGWWAAWWRMYDGADMKIIRTEQATLLRDVRPRPVSPDSWSWGAYRTVDE